MSEHGVGRDAASDPLDAVEDGGSIPLAQFVANLIGGEAEDVVKEVHSDVTSRGGLAVAATGNQGRWRKPVVGCDCVDDGRGSELGGRRLSEA